MSKAQLTVVYEYEINQENYPDECKDDHQRMMFDKQNMEDNGLLYDEMGFKVVSEDWRVRK